MTKAIIFFALVTLLSCNRNVNQADLNNSIKAKCDLIIISDSYYSKSINFVVSFENSCNEAITLFSNSCYKKTQEDQYTEAGIFLTSKATSTPIGLYLPTTLNVKPKKTIKCFFSYSTQYPNKWVIVQNTETIRDELTIIAKSSKLKYHYDPLLLKNFEKMNGNTITKDFKINMQNVKIIYKNDLTLRDVAEIITPPLVHESFRVPTK